MRAFRREFATNEHGRVKVAKLIPGNLSWAFRIGGEPGARADPADGCHRDGDARMGLLARAEEFG